MKTKSPLRLWRESQGLTTADLAVLTGLTRYSIATAENGYAARAPQSWRGVVERLGGSFDELASQYQEWREQAAANLLQSR